jgi:hypothetical protein
MPNNNNYPDGERSSLVHEIRQIKHHEKELVKAAKGKVSSQLTKNI